jgi:hypothetical protein
MEAASLSYSEACLSSATSSTVKPALGKAGFVVYGVFFVAKFHALVCSIVAG